MAFQVSAPNPLHTESLRGETNQLVRLNPLTNNPPVLPVGKTLEVLVSDNGRGQLGVMIQGQFYPAFLPKGYQPGDRLNVRVQSNEDALVLRILMGAKDGGQITNAKLLPTATLKQIFSLLLPQDQQGDLVQAAKVLHGSRFATLSGLLGEGSSAADPSAGLPKGTAQTANPPLPRALDELLTRLVGKHSIMNAETVRDPDQVARVLTHITEQSLKSSVSEAKHAVEALTSKLKADTPIERLVRVVTQHLEYLLQSHENLGFSEESATLQGGEVQARVQANLQLTSALSRYAMSSGVIGGSAALLERVRDTLTSGAAKHNPLSVLLQVFSGGAFMPLAQEGSTTAHDPLTQALQTLLSHIHTLRDQSAEDTTVRTQLQRVLSQLKLALPSRADGGLEQQLGATRAAKALETLLSGQDALNQVNPLLRTLGEPSMLMIPIVFGSQVTPLEVLLYPAHVDPDQDGNTKRGAQIPFTRVEIRIHLPKLGSLGVALAHREKELLVSITTPSAQTMELIQAQLPALDAILRERGFEQVSLRAELGETESQILPRVLSERNAVAVI